MICRAGLLTCFACLYTFLNVNAQDQDMVREIGQRYKDENAVMLKDKEHVVLRFEEGKLIARSFVEKQTLLLSSLAPNLYNNERIYHSSFNKLLEMDGASMIPSSRGYKTVKATEFKTSSSASESVFYDDVKQTAITYTGLVKDAITRVNYTIEYKDIHFLPAFYFQSYLPVVEGSFTVTVPREVKLKYILRGEHKELIKTSVEEAKNTRTYSFSAEHMPRFKTFDDAPTVAYYMPHVLIYVEEYKTKKDDKPVQVLGTVGNLYQYYYPFIRNINKEKDPAIEKLVADLTAKLSAPEDKAKAIYGWVQSNIKYVAFEDGMEGFIPRQAKLVCSRKYGDCKDMTSLLVAMCRQAGLDAHFTWIGTRHIPYTYEEAPLPVTDNHMICALKVNDHWIFMDGTDPSIQFGVPPYGIQGKEALIGIDSIRYKIVTIPEMPAEANVVNDSTVVRIADNALSGSVDISMKGYAAWRMGAMLMYQTEKDKEQAIKSITTRGSNKYIQKDFSSLVSDDAGKTVAMHSDFEIKDYAKQAGKEWYVNLNLIRSYESSWIDVKDRKISVENDYKSTSRQVVMLEIPKGYHVSYLPAPKERSVNGLWSYKIMYSQEAGKVKLTKEFAMNALYIKPDQFEAHNSLVSDLKSEYKESVVLAAD